MTEPVYEIRRAGAADAPAVRALTREAYAKWVPVTGREPLPMRADYDVAVREHMVDMLYSDGVFAALIETVREPDMLLVENVAVSPAFQGRGLGRMLMAHAETLARSLGYARIRLYTNKLFEANIRLYGRLGYTVDREEALNGGTGVHMSKTLSAGQ